MTRLLASVTNLDEARLATAAGADLIDLKNPAGGALGALPPALIGAISTALPDHPVSATIGDLPLHPKTIAAAVSVVGSTGVDYVKIGLFPGGDLNATLAALRPLARTHALIAILFADYLIALPTLDALARAGFAGAMLDTARKDKGSLTQLRPLTFLDRFIRHARSRDLLTGLAGSLRLEDVPALLDLKPDYLGFRSALCRQENRTARLDPQRLGRVRAAIPSPQDARTKALN